MALCGNGFDMFHTDASELIGHEIGCLLHIGLVLLQSADARDAEQVLQFIQKPLLIAAGIIDCWGGHTL